MPLWRILVKNSGNAACKDKRQRLEKGMFIETSTVSPIPPIGVAHERPMHGIGRGGRLAPLFPSGVLWGVAQQRAAADDALPTGAEDSL